MFKSESDCIAVICVYKHSRYLSVFTIFCDNELDWVELKWTSAGVRLTCPVLKLKHASLWLCFLFRWFFSPLYHNEFFLFYFSCWLDRLCCNIVFRLAMNMHNLANTFNGWYGELNKGHCSTSHSAWNADFVYLLS